MAPRKGKERRIDIHPLEIPKRRKVEEPVRRDAPKRKRELTPA